MQTCCKTKIMHYMNEMLFTYITSLNIWEAPMFLGVWFQVLNIQETACILKLRNKIIPFDFFKLLLLYHLQELWHLFIFLTTQASISICNPNWQLLCSLNNSLSFLWWYTMSNLSTKLAVLHHQYFQFLHIMHEYLPEASRKHVLSLLVASITNWRHKILTLETPTNSVVNTLRFSPWLLQFLVTVTLMADKMFCSLFHNGWSVYRTKSHRESNPRI